MSNKPISVTCDSGCNKSFAVNKFRTIKVKNGIEKTFFRCPNCKHEYVAYYASWETLKLQKEMRKLHVSMRGVDEQTLSSLILKESELKARIKQSMDEARRITEG